MLHASLLHDVMIAVEVVDRILIVVNEYEVISLRLLLFRLLVEDLQRRISAVSLVPWALFGRLGVHN